MIDIKVLKDISYEVIGAIHEVHRELGAGLNEYVYQEGLALQLAEEKIPFEKEKAFHPTFHGQQMKSVYKMDFLCCGCIVVECKAVEELNATHRAQLFNYMRLQQLPIGILVNFSPKYAEIERYFYDAETAEIYAQDGIPINSWKRNFK